MKHKLSIGIVIGILLALVVEVGAIPIRTIVLPKGTNQVKLTFGPVVPGVNYGVLVRTNSPGGHWIAFGPGFIGTSNKTISAVCNLSGNDDLKGLTVGSLNNWTFVAGLWEDPYGGGMPPVWAELALRADPFSAADPYGDPMQDG